MSASDKENIVIKDACILFDLIDLELLPGFYQLDLAVITTPEVLDEITEPEQLTAIQPYIHSGSLQVDRFGNFDAVLEIVSSNRGLSLTDAAVLEAAERRKAAVLSSDKSLRNESIRRGLTVRGVLWIIEQLYQHKLLTEADARNKLLIYPEVNKRAPKTEIGNLLKKLFG